VPPLPREDLVLLVITGRPPGSSLAFGSGPRAALDIGIYVARDVAAAWFESDEEDAQSLAERLEVVVGADTTRSGADSILVRMRITGKPGVRVDGLYLTGERDVFEFYNVGVRMVFTFK
jgi:translocation and assembly module TamB